MKLDAGGFHSLQCYLFQQHKGMALERGGALLPTPILKIPVGRFTHIAALNTGIGKQTGKPRQMRKDAHGPFSNCRLRDFVGRDCARNRCNDHIKVSRCSTGFDGHVDGPGSYALQDLLGCPTILDDFSSAKSLHSGTRSRPHCPPIATISTNGHQLNYARQCHDPTNDCIA